MEYKIGDIVKTKKQHPCGSNEWEIIRIGLDFKLKCQGCRSCHHDATRENIKNDKKMKKNTNMKILKEWRLPINQNARGCRPTQSI